MNLTPEQREALKEVVRCQLRLWDAGSAAEKLFNCDIATAGDVFWQGVAALDMVEDVNTVSDEELVEIFELE